MTYYSISAFINAVVSIILGLFVFYNNYRSKLNRSLFFWCFTVFFWSSFYFIWQIEADSAKALLWTRLLMLGAVWVPLAYFKVVTIFLDIENQQRKLTYFGYFLSAIFTLLLVTPLMVKNVEPLAGFLFWPKPGLAYAPFLAMFLGYTFYGLYLSIRALRECSPLKKAQIKFMLFGMVISIIGGSTNYFLWYGIPIKPYGNIFVSTYVLFTVYAIIKKELFNIKIILTELLTMLIGLVLLVQLFLARGAQAQAIGLIIFLLYAIIGYLLIRSTNKEVEKEERTEELAKELEELNLNLEKRVNEKTAELRVKISELSQSKKALINILEDNTEAREKMEEEKNKTLAIIANFTDPIIVLDKDFKISMINPAASRVFGLSGADLGRAVPTDNKFSMSNFRPVIKKDYEIKPISEDGKGQIFISEEITLKEAGLKEDAQGATYKVITAEVLSLNNEPLGTMKIFSDTTREKAIDKLKSEFISVAAHQLRTPLSAIKWVLKMILDGDAGELTLEQRELLNKGYMSNERIIRLVNDLLNVSRIEEGKFGFNFEKVDFNKEVLDTAISNVEGLAAKNHQTLTVLKPDQLPQIYLDKERMVMVMQNLLDNAIKYTPEYGKIKITIEVDNQFLRVKIKDQGVGIPEKDQPKIFSKFFRAANIVKLETEGTGLGLFIVRNIVEKHNGRVSLESEEGKGTEVSFFIPIDNKP